MDSDNITITASPGGTELLSDEILFLKLSGIANGNIDFSGYYKNAQT